MKEGPVDSPVNLSDISVRLPGLREPHIKEDEKKHNQH